MKQNFKVLNSFIDSISIIDKTGEIIFTNNSWNKFSKENDGNKNKNCCGTNYISICENTVGEDLQSAIDAKNGILSVINQRTKIFELEYPCHSLEKNRWFILRVVPYESNSDYFIISHINITNRKLAEQSVDLKNQQLITINERLESSLYKLVHDIQGPLNSIQGLINLTKSSDKQSTINPYMQIMDESISNLKEYIQTTLKLSSSFLSSEKIDLKAITDEILEAMKYSENFNLFCFEIDVKQDVDFYSNKSEVSSILSNILTNTIKYFDSKKIKKTISIHCKIDTKEANISIKDNGIGIAQDLINKIFHQNFQINKTSKLGVGLGLFMVQKSIKSLNGKISVTSVVDEGTEFTIVIPNEKND